MQLQKDIAILQTKLKVERQVSAKIKKETDSLRRETVKLMQSVDKLRQEKPPKAKIIQLPCDSSGWVDDTAYAHLEDHNSKLLSEIDNCLELSICQSQKIDTLHLRIKQYDQLFADLDSLRKQENNLFDKKLEAKKKELREKWWRRSTIISVISALGGAILVLL